VPGSPENTAGHWRQVAAILKSAMMAAWLVIEQPGANAAVGAGPVRASVINPALSPITFHAMRSTRVVISDAARRDNVINRIWRGRHLG
jgi:hypothetical protein